MSSGLAVFHNFPRVPPTSMSEPQASHRVVEETDSEDKLRKERVFFQKQKAVVVLSMRKSGRFSRYSAVPENGSAPTR